MGEPETAVTEREPMKKSIMFQILLTGCLLFLARPGIADQQASRVDKILSGIEKRYAGKGFSAAFFQESMLKAMQISDTAEGRLTVKRPGKMRWEYSMPDKQTIVTDGKSLWIYRPSDNQVMVGKAPDFFGQGKGAGFLSDTRMIRKQFTIKELPPDNPAYDRLHLTPNKPSEDLAEIILSIKKDIYQVDQITTFNAYGDETRIVLSDYQFNIDPADSLFTFEIPPGVDVVYMDNP